MKVITTAVFGAWLLIATAAGAIVTSWHSVALPSGPKPDRASQTTTGRWRLRHYLSPDCACSRSVAAYLASRGPVPGVDEEVILIEDEVSRKDTAVTHIGEEMKRSLEAHAFTVTLRRANSVAAEDGVEGVPTLEAIAPDSRIAYRGGYNEHGAASGQYLDTAILADLRALKPRTELRILGCATSERLRRRQDPFGFKR